MTNGMAQTAKWILLSLGIHSVLVMLLNVDQPVLPTFQTLEPAKAVSAHLVFAATPQVKPVESPAFAPSPIIKPTVESTTPALPAQTTQPNLPEPSQRAIDQLTEPQKQQISDFLLPDKKQNKKSEPELSTLIERLKHPKQEWLQRPAQQLHVSQPQTYSGRHRFKAKGGANSPVLDESIQADGSVVVQTKDGGCYLVQDQALLNPLESGQTWLFHSGCQPRESKAWQAFKAQLKQKLRGYHSP